MTASAIAAIFDGKIPEETDVQESKADRRRAQAEAKDAARMTKAKAKAEAKAAREKAKAEARTARAEEKAAAKAERDEAETAAQVAQPEAPEIEDATDPKADAKAARAEAKAARAEAKAAAKLERQAAALAKREAREVVGSAVAEPTEPEIDDADDAERPIADAAKLQRDKDEAQKWEADTRARAKEEAAKAKAEAAEDKQKRRQEAAELKAKADEVKQKERQQAATAKAEADAAKQKAREDAAAAKAAAKRERDEAKVAAKQESRAAKPSRRAVDDHIVEAPREPKRPLFDRLRPAQADAGGDSEGAPSNVLATVAIVVGALGFAFSLILAIGAFMIALNPLDDSGLFNLVSDVCDFLVGPLRGLFSFSGTNGDSKEGLLAWGLGSMVYLALGWFIRSLLAAKAEDG